MILTFKRATRLPSATKIEAMENAPGGGSIVTVTDPEGFPMALIHGQTPREPDHRPEKLDLNYEMEKPRSRKFIRLNPGPAEVFKV